MIIICNPFSVPVVPSVEPLYMQLRRARETAPRRLHKSATCVSVKAGMGGRRHRLQRASVAKPRPGAVWHWPYSSRKEFESKFYPTGSRY